MRKSAMILLQTSTRNTCGLYVSLFVTLLLLTLFRPSVSLITVPPGKSVNLTFNQGENTTTIHTRLLQTSENDVGKISSEVISTVSTLKDTVKTTKVSSHNATSGILTTKVYANTKAAVKNEKTQTVKPNSSVLRGTTSVGVHTHASLQQRLASIECDLPVLPRESRVWRGNETHELNFPVKMKEECSGSATSKASIPTSSAGVDECPPFVVSWEGSADIQSGDVLIVHIAESLFLSGQTYLKNDSLDVNATGDRERIHRALPSPAVYQVTRHGHEHCDVSTGMLLDITPLDDGGDKLITLYNKDLNEGVNLLIVVSPSWGPQCVRLKVTVKSDNCGEAQACSGKGVCYTNVSMEGYECQCCPGFTGAHCDERNACNPSPCLNNGICVELTQQINGLNYHCLCPYGFTGRKCEKDPCYSTPCLNGGSCMSMAMNGSTTFHCECPDGWIGAHCERSASGGACASNPCINGICVEHDEDDIDGDSYRCFCQPGYTGEQCELEYNECESSPCSNGGTCTDRVGSFICSCGRGYAGKTCQLKVDLCSPNPCSEQRYCVDRGNSYICECPRGYISIGDECHEPTQSPCDNNPCEHGGTCWSGVDSFYCSCRPGYTGRLCEQEFVLEPVVGGSDTVVETDQAGGGGSVRDIGVPMGLYHDRLHNVYIAAGTLGAAIAIVGVVVTACHCRVNKTYARLLSRFSRTSEPGQPHHWLQDKGTKSAATAALYPHHNSASALDTADMYYTLDFSDSQSSPLIQ